MSNLLKENTDLKLSNIDGKLHIKKLLGDGSQGEVYLAEFAGKKYAVKWYKPSYLKKDLKLKERLKKLIKIGSPSSNFLWPTHILESSEIPSFGYLMKLREPRFHSINDLMHRKVDPSCEMLALIGFNLADSFFKLHSQGLSYRDISFGNVFFDPNAGEVVICDNDNVSIDTQDPSGILGTPRFMAPEIVSGKALPSRSTDLFSLSVLLFYFFFISHPLEGNQEYRIHSLDYPAMKKLYGDNPIFIFDPNNDTNRPVPGYQDNPIAFWKVYPPFFKKYFIKAFTVGLKDPAKRVQESEWKKIFIQLMDSVVYCNNCGEDNYWNPTGGDNSNSKCYHCGKEITPPMKIKLDDGVFKREVFLNANKVLYSHHIDADQIYNFERKAGEVSKHPSKPNVWGLKNLTDKKWTGTFKDGKLVDVMPGKRIKLEPGLKINFGNTTGTIE